MSAEDLFAFMQERHAIYVRRAAGQPWPWTHDHVLQTQFFTNVYRELDKVTVWYREHVRNPWRHDSHFVAWCTYVARQFNRIDVLSELLRADYFKDPLTDRGDAEGIYEILRATRPSGPWTNAAYIISTSGHPGKDKLQGICCNLEDGHQDLEHMMDEIMAVPAPMRSIEKTCDLFRRLPGVGRFIAYEMATDLTHTCVLGEASDIMTWANPGPGAKRGLNRVHERSVFYSPMRHQMVQEMRDLLAAAPVIDPAMPLTMREIEHSLCEYDKYKRAQQTGRTKRRYRYAGRNNP